MNKQDIIDMIVEAGLTVSDVKVLSRQEPNNGSVYKQIDLCSRHDEWTLHLGDMVIFTSGDRWLDSAAIVTREGKPYENGSGYKDIMYYVQRLDGDSVCDVPHNRMGLRLVCRAEDLHKIDEHHQQIKMIRSQEDSEKFYTLHFERRRANIRFAYAIENLCKEEGITL